MRKLGFKLSITEAELNLLDAYKKKNYISNKNSLTPIIHQGNSTNTITLSYSVEYLTPIIFCESVLGVSHMPYAEDFANFGQKEQFKIKIKLKQRKMTRNLL